LAIFKGLEDVAAIENWPLSTTVLLVDASSLENPSEYQRRSYIPFKRGSCFKSARRTHDVRW